MSDWTALTDEAFRAVARQFLIDHYPPHLRFLSHRPRWHDIKPWYLTLSQHGWIAPNWPVDQGGMGLSVSKLLIWLEEQEAYGAARIPDHGVTMIGPVLFRHGTEEQRAFYLPKILSGEHTWAQGYSEPNAGSDLASLRTEAVPDGDEFVVTGQKIWTTLAQDMTHIYMLVRTDKTVKKQLGISMLLVDLKSPGITITPIVNLAGDDKFCQVFFDQVRVPRANLVGALHNGWTVAKNQLGYERIHLGSPKMPQYTLARLKELAERAGAFGNAAFVDRYVQLSLDVTDLAALYTHYVDYLRRGEALPPSVSLLKIFATETYQRITELTLEVAGPAGALEGHVELGDEFAPDLLTHYYLARPATIYGGSNEIQRNILAKSVLKLPA